MAVITQIRDETAADHAAVRALNLAAFDGAGEADLVHRLRRRASPLVSLVAERRGDIVGHILFSPVELDGHPGLRAMGLAPMAVHPDWQRRGIGKELVRNGIGWCASLGFEAVFVLGHPEYYPRFGFRPASGYGISSEYDAPDEAFMALELEPGALLDLHGMLRYHEAFNDL